jgi:hypothetical protein
MAAFGGDDDSRGGDSNENSQRGQLWPKTLIEPT